MSDEPATDTLDLPRADESRPTTRPRRRREYRRMVGGGPSAAFFDLDRTLIAGSSAFILGRTARVGRAACRPASSSATPASALRVQAARRQRQDDRRRARPHPRRRRRACARTTSSRSTPRSCRSCWPRSARRPAGCSTSTATPAATPTSCRRRRSRSSSRWPTSLGMTAGIGTRGEVVDGVYNGRARRAVLLRRRARSMAMEEIARWDGLDLGAVLRLLRLGERPADARRPSATRSPSTPTPRSPATPAPTAGRSSTSASARRR